MTHDHASLLATFAEANSDNDLRQPPPSGSDRLPAGYTYLGQLIAHDLLGRLRDPDGGEEHEPAPPHRLDLRCVYGDPPYLASGLFDRRGRFLLGETRPDADSGRRLPNDLALENHKPLAAVPRNDSNLVLSQLHVAFLHLHNAIVGDPRLVPQDVPPEQRIAEARAIAAWHYQAVILDDYLPEVCDPHELRVVPARRSPNFLDRNVSRELPAAFRFAALRFGHSQIANRYVLNDRAQILLVDLFSHRGFRSTPLRAIRYEYVADWRRFFEYPDDPVPTNGASLMDPHLAMKLFDLPDPALPDDRARRNLAQRDLQHQQAEGLPTGQQLARDLGLEALSGARQIGIRIQPSADNGLSPDEARRLNLHLNQNTPLWFYVLAEAHHQQAGRRLGQLGTRIVAETVYRVLDNNPDSPLHDHRRRPDRRLPNCRGPRVRMWQLLDHAGVTHALGDGR